MRKEVVVPDAVAEYGEYRLEIYQDEDSEFSSRDADNLGKIVTWHKVYDFTDESAKRILSDDALESPRKFEEYAEKHGFIYRPLYAYEHSGIVFSLTNETYPFNDPWDAYQIGYIFTTDEDIKKWFGTNTIDKNVIDKVYREFVKEIGELNEDMRGNMFYCVLYKNGKRIDGMTGLRFEDFSRNDFWESLAKTNNISENDIKGLRKSLIINNNELGEEW